MSIRLAYNVVKSSSPFTLITRNLLQQCGGALRLSLFLLRRLRAVHTLYDDACATMTLDQVDTVERPGVLPIAFSLVHQLLIEDGSIVFAGGPSPQFNTHWASRLELAISDHGKARTVDEMMGQRIGDYTAFLEFQQLVFGVTEDFVESVAHDS